MSIHFAKAFVPPSSHFSIHHFFKSSWWKRASAARNWIHVVPQTAATAFAFSSVVILFLWVGVSIETGRFPTNLKSHPYSSKDLSENICYLTSLINSSFLRLPVLTKVHKRPANRWNCSGFLFTVYLNFLIFGKAVCLLCTLKWPNFPEYNMFWR